MARISTGPNYGNTSRKTSSRLIGGGDQPSISGPLEVRDIDMPALQPAARPVPTFISASPGPTLGGAPVIPAPPRLPDAPRDMANLANALSAFNPTLNRVADVYVDQQKDLDERRKQEGAAFAQQASNLVGAYTGIADAQRKLEKRAGEGDMGAQRLLQYMLSRHPGMYAYLAESAQETAILTGTANLSRVVRNDPEIPDGQGGMVKLSSLGPDDPRVTGFFRQQIISDEVTSPRVYAKYQNLMINGQNQAREVHEGLHIQHRVEEFRAEHATKVQALAYAYHAKTYSVAQANGLLQSVIDDQRFIGLPKKEQDGIIDGLWNQWLASVLSAPGAAESPPSPEQVLAPFRSLQVGPIENRFKADGTPNEKLLLVSRLGGAEWLAKAEAQINANWLQRYNQTEALGQAEAQNFASDLFSANMPPDVMQNPDLARAAKESALQQIQARYGNDPVKAAKATAVLERMYSDADTAYNAEARRNLELQYSFDLVKARQNPEMNVQLQRRLQDDVAAGRVSDNFAQSTIGTLASFLDASSKPYDEQLSSLIRAKQDNWGKLSKDPRSYDGQSVGEYESNAWAKAESGMLQEGQKVINEGLAAGKSRLQINDDLENLFKSRNWGLKPREIPTTQTRVYTDPKEALDKNTGWGQRLLGGGISPEKANSLKAQSRVRPLFGEEALVRELDAVTSGKELSPEMQQVMKAITTGPNKMTPSEFFIKQLELNGLLKDLPPEDMQKIKALDGSLKVSRAPAPPKQQWPVEQNPYLAMIRNMGNTAMNVLVPPAQAAGGPSDERWMQDLGKLPGSRGTLPPPPPGGGTTVAMSGPAVRGSTALLGVIRELRGANQFRGVSLVANKQKGDYQSDPRENWFFDFKPDIVPKAIARAQRLSQQDINALTFTALTEAGPTTRGKLEVAANLINRSAIAGNKPIVDIAKAPNQYEGVFGYSKAQVISATEGRRIFGRRYDQVRKLIAQGI